nr:MAG: hypothetical protein 1 [Picornavirales sp.]
MESFKDLCNIEHREVMICNDEYVIRDSLWSVPRIVESAMSVSVWHFEELVNTFQYLMDNVNKTIFIMGKYGVLVNTESVFLDVVFNQDRYVEGLKTNLLRYSSVKIYETVEAMYGLHTFDKLETFVSEEGLKSLPVIDVSVNLRNCARYFTYRLGVWIKWLTSFVDYKDCCFFFSGEVTLYDILSNRGLYSLVSQERIGKDGNIYAFYISKFFESQKDMAFKCGKFAWRHREPMGMYTMNEHLKCFIYNPNDHDYDWMLRAEVFEFYRDLPGVYGWQAPVSYIAPVQVKSPLLPWFVSSPLKTEYIRSYLLSHGYFSIIQIKDHISNEGWIEDLTEDGDVEANPGPVMSTLGTADYQNEGLKESIKALFTGEHKVNLTIGIEPALIGFVTFLITAYKARHQKLILCGFVTTYLLTLGLTREFIQQMFTKVYDSFKSLLEKIYNWMARAVGYKNEAKEDCNKVTILDTIVQFFQKLWNFNLSGKEFIEMCKNISWVTRGMQSIEWICSKLIEIVTWIYNKITGKREMLLSEEFTQELMSWMSTTKDLMATAKDKDITDVVVKAQNELNAGQSFYSIIKSSPGGNSKLAWLFYEQYNLFKNWFVRLRREPAAAKLKVPAYCVGLHGPPGVGKSGLVQAMIMNFIKEDLTLTEDDKKDLLSTGKWQDLIYAANGMTKHDDGLRMNTAYWVFDDFDQVNDATEPNNEFMNVIRICNPYPCLANMAELSEKGQIPLKAKAVIASSNTEQLNSRSIKHTKAFLRRLDSWWVTVKPGYCDDQGRINVDKVNGFLFDIYQFQAHDLETGQHQGPIYDWNGFSDIILGKFRKTQREGLSFVEGVDVMAKRLAEDLSQKLNDDVLEEVLPKEQFDEKAKVLWDSKKIAVKDIKGSRTLLSEGVRYRCEGFGLMSIGVAALATTVAGFWLQPSSRDRDLALVAMGTSSDFVPFEGYKDMVTEFTIVSALVDEKSKKVKQNELCRKYRKELAQLRAYYKDAKQVSPSVLEEFRKCQEEPVLLTVVGWLLKLAGVFMIGGVVSACFVKAITNVIKSVWSWMVKGVEWFSPSNFNVVKVGDEEFAVMKQENCEPGKFSKIMYPIKEFFKVSKNGLWSLKNKICNLLCRYVFNLKKIVSNVWLKLSPGAIRAREQEEEVLQTQVAYDPVYKGNTIKRTVVEGFNRKALKKDPTEEEQEELRNESLSTGLTQCLADAVLAAGNNHYDVFIEKDNEWEPCMSGFFLKAQTFVVPAHILPTLVEADRMAIKGLTGEMIELDLDFVKMKLYMLPSMISHLPEDIVTFFDGFLPIKKEGLLEKAKDLLLGGAARDAIALKFSPKIVRAHKDLTGYFVSRAEWPNFVGTVGSLVYYTPQQLSVISSSLSADEKALLLSDSMSEYKYRYWMYSAPTKPGDCGNLLFSKTGKILGFHTMSTTSSECNKCWAVPLSKEGMREFTIDNANEQYTLYVPPIVKPAYYVPPLLEGFDVLGKLDEGYFQPDSKLRQSVVHGMVDSPKKAPALLKGEEDLLMKGFAKYKRRKVPGHFDFANRFIDDKFARRMVKEVFRRIGRNASRPRFPYTLTLEQAIKGIPDTHIRAIPMSTSPGFGWEKGFGKHKLFPDDELVCEELANVLKDCREKAFNRIIPFMPAIATLKDELKPLAKIGNPRVFTAYTVQEVILTKQLFGGFVDWFVSNVCSNQSLVGTKATGANIHAWVEDIMEFKNLVCMDFSKFDADENTYLLGLIMEEIGNWYKRYSEVSEEDELMRQMLIQSLLNLVVVVRNFVVKLTHSLGSGHPLTAVLNTLYNMLLSVIAFFLQFEIRRKDVIGFMSKFLRQELEILLKCFPPEQFESAALFYTHVKAGYYGDDFIASVSNLLQDFFNMQVLALIFLYLGHKVTTGEKEEVLSKFVPMNQFEILKRKPVFCLQRGQWVLALNEDTVREIPNWTRRSAGSSNLLETKNNLETASREMALHGEEKYEVFVEQYAHVAPQVGINVVFLPYRTMLRRYVTTELFGAYKF